jgi:hypothetical protein
MRSSICGRQIDTADANKDMVDFDHCLLRLGAENETMGRIATAKGSPRGFRRPSGRQIYSFPRLSITSMKTGYGAFQNF